MGHIEQRYVWDQAETQYGPLMSAIEKARRECPTGQLGAGGDWAGRKTLFDDERTNELQGYIRSLLPPLRFLHGWGFMMRQGDTVKAHDHALSHLQKGLFNDWAGVYYVDCPDGSGVLCPEVAPDEGRPPQNGELILFRGHMVHFVTEHKSRYPRYSISFNAVEQR